MKRPSVSQTLALKAAAAAAAQNDPEESEGAAPLTASEAPHLPERARGRPRGRREVAAKQTIYLDAARHAALVRIAEDRGRSVHSLIIEGIDHVVGKPVKPGWQ